MEWGLSGAERARRGWACHLATVPRYCGIGPEPYLNGIVPVPCIVAGSDAEGTPEDARKDEYVLRIAVSGFGDLFLWDLELKHKHCGC